MKKMNLRESGIRTSTNFSRSHLLIFPHYPHPRYPTTDTMRSSILITAVSALVAVAVSLAPRDCPPQCCQAVQSEPNPVVGIVIGLLGVVLTDADLSLGVGCTSSRHSDLAGDSRVHIGLPKLASCDGKVVCCSGDILVCGSPRSSLPLRLAAKQSTGRND